MIGKKQLTEENLKDSIKFKISPERLAFIKEALECGGCEVYLNSNKTIHVLYKTDSMGFDAVGIMMALYDTNPDKVDTWVAIETSYGVTSEFGTGDYPESLGVRAIYAKAIENAATCDFCGAHVGYTNLRQVGYANKSCVFCYKEAKAKFAAEENI